MGKDQHPRNTRPKTVSFSLVLFFYDDSGLLFYFHTTGNGHKILVSIKAAKLPQILLGWAIIRYLNLWKMIHLYSFSKKNSFDYFGKMIGDLSKGLQKYFRILPRVF